jgi:hypothetical protein
LINEGYDKLIGGVGRLLRHYAVMSLKKICGEVDGVDLYQSRLIKQVWWSCQNA